MPFIVATWNVQRLTEQSRDYKWNVVEKWIAAADPDLVGLIEVGPGVKVPGYTLIDYVNTLRSDDKESQLCIAAYVKDGCALESPAARTLRSRGDSQRRAELKVTVKFGVYYTFYFVHANASSSGGIDSVHAAVSSVRMEKNSAHLGDFNYDLNVDGAKLQIANDNTIKVLSGTDLTGAQARKSHKKGGLLDFAITSLDLVIASVNMDFYGNWKTIDHAPIVFRVG